MSAVIIEGSEISMAKPTSVSIVIPVFNEEEAWYRCSLTQVLPGWLIGCSQVSSTGWE